MENRIWRKSGSYHTMEEFFRAHGLVPRDLLYPARVEPSSIENLETAAYLIFDYIEAFPGKDIYIVGDYDADGITATAILVKLLRYLCVEPHVIIPRRFSDGYGISTAIVANIYDSLILTVDNGVSAIEPIRIAKEHGNTVIVIDHHLSGTELPAADVIVDPHINPDANGFHLYCGAGLAYKLAEYMVLNNGKDVEVNRMFADITVLAAIGTIADVMPMVGDNRFIIKAGLDVIRSRKFELVSPGLRELIMLAGDRIDEDSVKYKIGPLLNAPGRLYDAGSTSALKAVLCSEAPLAVTYAQKMSEINERRKGLTAEWIERILVSDFSDPDIYVPVRVIRCSGLPEGLTGLIAGKLAADFQCVTFVFSESKSTPGVLKGSGRTFGGFDISGLLPLVKDVAIAVGGHAGAAGISVAEERFAEVKQIIERYVSAFGDIRGDDVVMYDLDFDPEHAQELMDKIKRYAPYGEGVPKPVFRFRNFQCIDNRYGDYYRFMGSGSEHLKLFGNGIDAVGFGKAEEYQMMAAPPLVDLIGCVSENIYNGTIYLQYLFTELKYAEGT